MDTANLLQALQYSVGKTQEEIRMAEQFLQQAKTAAGFTPGLLVIACNKEVNIFVRQAAAVNLQSTIKHFWTRRKEGQVDVIEGDKQTIKDNILEATINCADTPKIYKEFLEIIIHVVNLEFPEEWPGFLPAIIAKLRDSNNFQEVYGSLLALSAIFKNYKKLFADTTKLEGLVQETFGFLEAYSEKLLGDYGLQAATAMHVILKIFTSATYTIMPTYLLNNQNMEKWMTMFKLILDKDLDPSLQSPTEDPKVIAQREKNIYWLNKKFCSRVISSFINKFRAVTSERADYKEFSKLFLATYAVPFLKTFMETLIKRKDHYIHVKVLFYALRYINKALKSPELADLLEEHIDFILFDTLIPCMFLTPKDKDDWEENPVEFIRGEEDVMERPNNLKTTASYILQRITSQRFKIKGQRVGNAILMKFMNHAAEALGTNVDPRTKQPVDIRMKEALLHIIGRIQGEIMDSEQIQERLEFLLEKFVVPELLNQSPFIRYRACWLFGMFGAFDYQNKQIVVTSTESLYKCLIDNQLPVKVEAGIALERVLEHEEALNILKPGLQKIFEIYLILIDQIDNEQLVSALEGIIEKFGDDIGPYALDIIKHLGKIFAKNVDDEGEDQNDDGFDIEEKQLAASGCLAAISNVIKCKISQEVLVAAQDIIVPLLNFTLIDDRTDDVESGLQMLSCVLYKMDTINERMWAYFPELCYMIIGKPEEVVAANFAHLSEEEKFLLKAKIMGYGIDYIGEMVPVFQNYVQKGRDVIFTARDPIYKLTYIELLFKAVDRVCEICYNGIHDQDMALASVLYITVMENYPKEIDNLIPYFLDKVIEHLPKARYELYRKVLVQIVAIAMWYSPDFTLQYIEQKGASELVFKTWIRMLPKLKYLYECERVMYGLSSIFRANVASVPPLVLSSLPDLLKELVKLSSKILVLREEDEDDRPDTDDEEDDEDDTVFDKTMEKLAKFQAKDGKSPFVDKDSFNPADMNNLAGDDLDEIDKVNDFKALEWLHNQGQYDSPFADKCEVTYLKESLEFMQQHQTDAYNQLVGCLTQEDKITLEKNFVKAHEQVLEYQEMIKNQK